MLESWLASPAAKLKKRCGEMLGNVDVAGIGQLLQSHEAPVVHGVDYVIFNGKNIYINCLELL